MVGGNGPDWPPDTWHRSVFFTFEAEQTFAKSWSDLEAEELGAYSRSSAGKEDTVGSLGDVTPARMEPPEQEPGEGLQGPSGQRQTAGPLPASCHDPGQAFDFSKSQYLPRAR